MSDPKTLPRACWFKTGHNWERGTLLAWSTIANKSTIADKAGHEPVGIVEDQAGKVEYYELRFLSLGNIPPPKT